MVCPDIADLRFRRNVALICSKGDRLVGELLAEIGAERSIQTIIDSKLARYATIDGNALSVTGGNAFPVLPLYEAIP